MNQLRATTVEQKVQVINNLLALWLKYPELRLGQLIDNVTGYDNIFSKLYNVEDLELVSILKEFYELREKK